MTCPSLEQLAAAAADEHPRATEHAVTCRECAELIAQQRAVRTLAGRLDVPRLSPLRRAKLALAHDPADEIGVLAHQLAAPHLTPARRAALAAETLARADLPRRRVPWRGLGAVVAAAALIAVVVWSTRATRATTATGSASRSAVPRGDGPSRFLRPAVASAHESVRTPVVAPARDERGSAGPRETGAPDTGSRTGTTGTTGTRGPDPAHDATAPRQSATVVGDGADFTRDTGAQRDTVQLHDGTISIDARDRAPVSVAIGDTTIHVRDAHVEIRAADGVIVSAQAFAGSVERTSPESRAVISEGEIWTAPPAESSLAAFRIGWKALHEGRNDAALAAFDRAGDPVVAEEAAFWAAVAAQRAGDRDGASQRFRAFIDAYPHSTRVDAARAALRQLP